MLRQSNNTEGGETEIRQADQINEGRRNIAKLFGAGAVLYMAHGAVRLLGVKTEDKKVDTEIPKDEPSKKDTPAKEENENKKSNKSKEELEIESEILKKYPDAKRDPGTSYLICGPRKEKILEEDVVEFRVAGEIHYLKRNFYERFMKANEKMKKETGKEIKIFSSIRSNKKNKESGEKRQGGFSVFDPPASGECNGAHIMAQAFDVVNFDEAYEYLAEQGFEGGLPGIWKDPWHFYDPKNDIIPKLSQLQRIKRIAANKAYYKFWKLRKWVTGKMPW